MTGVRIGFILLLLVSAPAVADTIFLEASQDATLIEDPAGALANGSGPVFFAGRTNQDGRSVRRGLIRFDVAGALPKGVQVEDVRLTLYVQPSNPTRRLFRLHRVQADWGEGASYAAGGSGATSLSGDVTWIHTYYDDTFWSEPGGRFLPHASGALEVGDSDFYTYESTPQMVADVRMWLAAPHRNFGWILIGDETTPQNVKSFASREEGDPALRPMLEVSYRRPGHRGKRPEATAAATGRSAVADAGAPR